MSVLEHQSMVLRFGGEVYWWEILQCSKW